MAEKARRRDALGSSDITDDALLGTVANRFRKVSEEKPNAPGYKERKTFGAEVAYMKGWLEERARWLDGECGEG